MPTELFRTPPHTERTREILERHWPMVYATCLRALGDAASAEDAAQAVFIIYARKAAGFTDTNVAAWLHRTAVFVARQARRNALIRHAHEFEAAAMRSKTSTATLPEHSDELRAAVDECLERLPAAQREAIVLRYLEERSEEEAARELRIPVGTLSARVSRGLAALRAQLKRRGLIVSLAALAALLAPANVAAAPAIAASVYNPGAFAAAEPASRASVLAEETLRMMSTSKLVAAITGAVAALACCAALWQGQLSDRDAPLLADAMPPAVPSANAIAPAPAATPRTPSQATPRPAEGPERAAEAMPDHAPVAQSRQAPGAGEPETFELPVQAIPLPPPLDGGFLNFVFVRAVESAEEILLADVNAEFPPLPPDFLLPAPFPLDAEFQIALPPPPDGIGPNVLFFRAELPADAPMILPFPAPEPATLPKQDPDQGDADF
ncbi:MAG TPA: sigma-70 family RNA polymerase sigma factor [Planctomycetota bacterium]|nr:sigma-70 family RNA polymerase sigma factor [Planctomycetota bacterium]